MRTTVFAFAFAFAFALAPAQAQVCVTGRVTPVGGPTICQQGETHYLECTRVFLRSNLLDLNRFNGQIVRITGRDIGVTCRVLDVARVDPPPATLEWCGSPSTCCPVKFKVCPGGLGQAWLFLSTAPDYQPLGCGNTLLGGTLLIAPPLIEVWSGMLTAGCGEVTIPIPCNNSLVGLQVWLQGARRDIGPIGPLWLTNAVCFRIAPFLPPCAPTGC
jgi:hypothetical protein